MYFKQTKKELQKELKKAPRLIIPILSYCSLAILIGWVLKEASILGNLSYVITTVFVPLLTNTISWFTGENLLKAFRNDWIALPFYIHLLIIINCLIVFNLIKLTFSKELWTKRILNK